MFIWSFSCIFCVLYVLYYALCIRVVVVTTFRYVLFVKFQNYMLLLYCNALFLYITRNNHLFEKELWYFFSASYLHYSIGGLMPVFDLEDIMAGISVCRNQDRFRLLRLELPKAWAMKKKYWNIHSLIEPLQETTWSHCLEPAPLPLPEASEEL